MKRLIDIFLFLSDFALPIKMKAQDQTRSLRACRQETIIRLEARYEASESKFDAGFNATQKQLMVFDGFRTV